MPSRWSRLVASIVVLCLGAPGAQATQLTASRSIASPDARALVAVHDMLLLFNSYCVGVGYDGAYFWITAGSQQTGSAMFYVIDEYGNMIDEQPQGGGAQGWGHVDLAWNGTYMFGSPNLRVNAFTAPGELAGFFLGPIGWSMAMTYDGASLYACGFDQNLWRINWQGEWGTFPDFDNLGGPWHGSIGLAWDEQRSVHWMSTADYSGDIHKLTRDGDLIETYNTLPEHDAHGGCTMADTRFGRVLVVITQTLPDLLTFYEIDDGQTPTRAASWGAIKALFAAEDPSAPQP